MTAPRVLVVVIAAAAAIAGGAFVVANLHTSASAWRAVEPYANDRTTLVLPAKRPAEDRAGAGGWVWPDETPGWKPGQRIKGFLVAGLKSGEVERARVAAARGRVDGADIRVIDSIRASKTALLAILAAPAADDPATTCLAAMRHRNATVRWWCPNEVTDGRRLADAPVLVAAASYRWAQPPKDAHPLYLVGVARGDVRRVVLDIPGWAPETLYRRGRTWGQFDAARMTADGRASLHIYGRGGLLETVRLTVMPGAARVFK